MRARIDRSVVVGCQSAMAYNTLAENLHQAWREGLLARDGAAWHPNCDRSLYPVEQFQEPPRLVDGKKFQ